MAALVRCSKLHIPAGPPHREATYRGHLGQRSKRSLICLTLAKKSLNSDLAPKIKKKTPHIKPTTIHEYVRSSDAFDSQSHQVFTTLHWRINALQFCVHQIVPDWKKKKHKFCLMTENIKLHRQPLPWNNCNSLHHALEQRPRTVSTLPATQEHYAACEWLNVHVCPTHRVSRYSVGLNVYYTIPMFMCADKTHKILNTFLYSSTSHDKLYSIFDFNIPNCCFLIFYVKEAVL